MTLNEFQIDQKLSQILQGKKSLLRPGEENFKLAKNTNRSFILNLSPHKQNRAGKDVCAHSTPGCRTGCLFTAGRGKMPNVELARRLNTEIFLKYRSEFITRLNQELLGLHMEAGLVREKWAVRLNGTSDLDFVGMIKNQIGYDILELYSNLVFYDYTKNFSHWNKYFGSPYYLTFSRSEANWPNSDIVLQMGGTVAVVFHPSVPNNFLGYSVFPGDISDERWLDPPGHIIGLKYKQAYQDNPLTNPFVVKI